MDEWLKVKLEAWREADSKVRSFKARKRIPRAACTCDVVSVLVIDHKLSCAVRRQEYEHELMFHERDWRANEVCRRLSKLQRRVAP